MNIGQRANRYSVYFAPRGRERLLALGAYLAQAHLNYDDKLIGIIGDAGSGKSSLVKGMFPGIDLVNDDDGMDIRRIMEIKTLFNNLDNEYDSSTYHIDIRFQQAFTQMFEIVEFIKGALSKGRRVIVEHFNLIYPYLGMNADLLIGIGEEIIITRPTVFGPTPDEIYDTVFHTLNNRKMAHTAEDLTSLVLEKSYQVPNTALHGDVRGGFVLIFDEKPEVDISELEEKVQELISQNLEISYNDENSIRIGDFEVIKCTGPRIHVRNTFEIENYHLVDKIIYDNNKYLIVGLVGQEAQQVGFEEPSSPQY